MSETTPAPTAAISTAPATTALKRANALDDEKWKVLLRRISQQRCTPFLGPETCFDFSVPPASILAEEWADEYGYPFDDRNNLSRVSQFVAYQILESVDAMKEEFSFKFQGLKEPDFRDAEEPYRILADLPLKFYVNTHYFAFMSQALRAVHKEPDTVMCGWSEPPRSDAPAVSAPAYDPSAARPMVFHMFGHVDNPSSLVLTEDDHLDFLVRTSERLGVIPESVAAAINTNSLLFFGYQHNDLDFRVLLRSLNRIWRYSPKRNGSSYAVQFIHVNDNKPTVEQIERLRDYCNRYCKDSMSIGVYWGTTREFLTELRQRWEDYSGNRDVG